MLQQQIRATDSPRLDNEWQVRGGTRFESAGERRLTFAVKWKPWTSEVCKTMEVLKTVVDRLRYLLRRVEYKLVSVSAT